MVKTPTLVGAIALCVATFGCHPGTDDRPYTVTLDLTPDIRALGSNDLFDREPALERILAAGPAAVPALVAAYDAEPETVRAGIVDALRRIGGTGVIETIVTSASDDDARVRYEAVIALGKLARPRTGATVERLLGDGDARVRMAAANACAGLCSSATGMDTLVEMALDEPSPVGAMAARSSLVAIVNNAGRPTAGAARRSIEKRAFPAIESADPLGRRARAALLAYDVGDDRGTAVLVTAVTELDDPRLLIHAVHALGDIGSSDAVPALVAFLDRPGLGVYGYDALRRMTERDVSGARAAQAAYTGTRPRHPLSPP